MMVKASILVWIARRNGMVELLEMSRFGSCPWTIQREVNEHGEKRPLVLLFVYFRMELRIPSPSLEHL